MLETAATHSIVPGPHELARLAALADLQISDTGPEETFDRIARIAKSSLGFPLAYVSFINLDQQIIKTQIDIPLCSGRRDAAFCDHTIRESKPLIVIDTLKDSRFSSLPQVSEAPHIRSYWGMPLTTRTGFNVGALCVLDVEPRIPGGVALDILEDLGRVTVESMELRAQATIDVLTGVQCRRSFLAHAERIFARHLHTDAPLSCVTFDIDYFKRLNDTFGHAVGDMALRHLGHFLEGQFRDETLVGRIGGEEFAVLLPGNGIYGAFAVAERLRKGVMSVMPAGYPPLTASFGVAERQGSDRTLGDLMKRADAHTYAAKSLGRNRTHPLLAAGATPPRTDRNGMDSSSTTIQAS